MEPENLSELTRYFIDASNKLVFSSEVSVEFPNINELTNSGSKGKTILP